MEETKMKKLLVITLALVMVLGMTTTAFATPTTGTAGVQFTGDVGGGEAAQGVYCPSATASGGLLAGLEQSVRDAIDAANLGGTGAQRNINIHWGAHPISLGQFQVDTYGLTNAAPPTGAGPDLNRLTGIVVISHGNNRQVRASINHFRDTAAGNAIVFGPASAAADGKFNVLLTPRGTTFEFGTATLTPNTAAEATRLMTSNATGDQGASVLVATANNLGITGQSFSGRLTIPAGHSAAVTATATITWTIVAA